MLSRGTQTVSQVRFVEIHAGQDENGCYFSPSYPPVKLSNSTKFHEYEEKSFFPLGEHPRAEDSSNANDITVAEKSLDYIPPLIPSPA